MLRISKLTDYGTVILASLACDPERVRTAAALADSTHIAAPTVSKLLKQLQRAGLVISTRGLHGGYQLARPATQISVAGDARCSGGTGGAHGLLGRTRTVRYRGDVQSRARLAAAESRNPALAARGNARASGGTRLRAAAPASRRA